MKKSILTALAVAFVGTLAAQTTTPQGTKTTPPQGTTMQQSNIQPPGAVSKRFSTDYPKMNATWTMSGKNYRAEYMDANSRLGKAVVYDETGAPVGMESEMRMGEYPASINEYYASSYPNESYRVWTTNDNTGKRNYFISRQSDIIWFDDKGVYTRKSSVIPDMPK